MAKLFEKIDDNPGDYFGMLVESVEDKKESLKEDSEYKTLAKLSNGLEVISYPYGYAVSDGYAADRFVVRDGKYIFDDGRFRLSDKDKQKILSLIKSGIIGESLKEDKFIPKDKMSKKDKKELDSKKRNTWGNTNPVTKVQPNKKAYDRKRDKKELDEAKHFLYKENADKFREAYEYVQKISDEMLWDSKKKEIDYEDALYYYNKLKEATKMVYNSFIGDDNYDPYEDGNVVLRG